MSFLRLGLGASLLLCTFAACSGATETAFLGAGSTSSSSSGGSSSTSSSSGDVSSSSSGDISSSSSGGSSGSSGVQDGGTSSGSFSDAKADVGPPVDPDRNRVFCGQSSATQDIYCAAGEVCCGERKQDSLKVSMFKCTAASACASPTQLPVACDDANDCATGEVCCGARVSLSMPYVRASCVQAGQCPGVRLCELNSTAPQCPAGSQCQTSALIDPFAVCQ
jgi:hypothetical protein